MLAHAFLTVITADERATEPTPSGLIPITVNELRRPFDALLLGPSQPTTTEPMVTLAPPTPSTSPRLPLPPTRRITMITNYDCSMRPSKVIANALSAGFGGVRLCAVRRRAQVDHGW